MKNVLIINQSSELYGADKALLELIEGFPVGFIPIVVLHEDGPLKVILEKMGIQVIKTSVIKVKRGILKPSFFINLPVAIIKSFIKIKQELRGKKIDLIHSNATSVFIGAFYGSFFRIPHIWHVHEIIERPKKVAHAYPYLIRFFSNKVIFNSVATSDHFIKILPKINLKSIIIHNGQKRDLECTSSNEIMKIRNSFCCVNESKIIVGLIGRISEIKGQHLALEAFSILKKKYPNIYLVFIGSAVKGKEEYVNSLYSSIKKLNLETYVSFVDFQKNIWLYYDAIDIVIVPSTEKESFGLVATEAMLSKKPVVAANHGGLSEIVVHNETGFLFKPNSAKDLSVNIEKLIQNPSLRNILGENGFKRVTENFSAKKYISGIEAVYIELTA